MATLKIHEHQITVLANSIFLDTCVLCAAYNPRDSRHSHAKDFILQDGPVLIPYIVIGEAWGLLVGREKRIDHAINMLCSLRDRPNTQFVPAWSSLLNESHSLCDQYRIDLVDAFLMCMSSFFTEQLGLRSPIQIATYDTRDFCKCYARLRFEFLDMRDAMSEN